MRDFTDPLKPKSVSLAIFPCLVNLAQLPKSEISIAFFNTSSPVLSTFNQSNTKSQCFLPIFLVLLLLLSVLLKS